MALKDLFCFIQCSTNRSCYQILFRHYFFNLYGVILDETHITICDNTNKLLLFLIIDDRNTRNAVFGHEMLCVKYLVFRSKEEWISNDSAFGALYFLNLFSL